MNCDERELPLPAHPRPSTPLFAWILAHGIILLQDGVDAIVVDGDAISSPEHVRDCGGSLSVLVIEVEYPFDEIRWILGIWLPSGCVERWDLVGVAVFLGELLDATTADVVPVGDVSGVKLVIDHKPTDPGDIILFQLHLFWTSEGVIVSTKSFPDSTNELQNSVLTFSALANAIIEEISAELILQELIAPEKSTLEIRDFLHGKDIQQWQRENLLYTADVIDGDLKEKMKELRSKRNKLVHSTHGRYREVKDREEFEEFMDDVLFSVRELRSYSDPIEERDGPTYVEDQL